MINRANDTRGDPVAPDPIRIDRRPGWWWPQSQIVPRYSGAEALRARVRWVSIRAKQRFNRKYVR
ncbi:MAG: hypothetical protein IPN48_05695 [Sphingomonadales bacterium]|nr:hypothetical protein [Sphingomonadales bacterium]